MTMKNLLILENMFLPRQNIVFEFTKNTALTECNTASYFY